VNLPVFENGNRRYLEGWVGSRRGASRTNAMLRQEEA